MEKDKSPSEIVIPKETKPYIEEEGYRLFIPNQFNEELEWHVDWEDRIITVVQPGNWKIQFDEAIPRTLKSNEEIFIKKMKWHRIISGDSPLIIKIQKLR